MISWASTVPHLSIEEWVHLNKVYMLEVWTEGGEFERKKSNSGSVFRQ